MLLDAASVGRDNRSNWGFLGVLRKVEFTMLLDAASVGRDVVLTSFCRIGVACTVDKAEVCRECLAYRLLSNPPIWPQFGLVLP